MFLKQNKVHRQYKTYMTNHTSNVSLSSRGSSLERVIFEVWQNFDTFIFLLIVKVVKLNAYLNFKLY